MAFSPDTLPHQMELVEIHAAECDELMELLMPGARVLLSDRSSFWDLGLGVRSLAHLTALMGRRVEENELIGRVARELRELRRKAT